MIHRSPLRRARLHSVAAPLVASLAACSDPAPTPPAAPVYTVPRCPIPDGGTASEMAPLRQPDGGHRCAPVGADLTASSGEWPDTTSAAEPIVYVALGASPATGTRDAPFHDLAAALTATPAPATIALSRGTFTLGTTARVTASVALLGVGATTLVAPAGMTALHVGPGAADPLAVSLSRITVRGDAAAPALLAQGARTTLTLRDVRVDGGLDGARIDGASLCAQGFTVRGAVRAGVELGEGSAAALRSVVLRDGAGVGVLADRAALVMREGLVAHNGRDGIIIRGPRTTEGRCVVGATTPAEACPSVTVCPGVTFAQTCLANIALVAGPDEPAIAATPACRAVSTLDDVAIVDNNVTGLRVDRVLIADGTPTATRNLALSQPGPTVVASRLVIAGTRLPAGLTGGDGLYVGPTARVTLDEDVRSDAQQGRGSEFVANTRAGVLVDGDRVTVRNELRAHGQLTASGALLGSNLGPGLYAQERAVVARVAYSRFEDNAALGLGVTSNAQVPLIDCNGFINNRIGTLVTETAGTLRLGDGLSISEGSTERARITACEFRSNARFGLVVSGAGVTLGAANRATANASGVGFFNAEVVGATTGLDGVTTTLTSGLELARGYQTAPDSR